MVGSLLAQSVSQAGMGGVGTLSTIVGLGVFGYIVYAVLVQKNTEIKKKLTGLRGLLPAIVLGIMTIIPASVLAVFGPAEALVTAIFSIMTSGLVGYLLAWVTLYVIDYIQPDVLPDWFFLFFNISYKYHKIIKLWR